MDSPNKKRKRNPALDPAITSEGGAELAILHLFNTYSIDLNKLQSLLISMYSSLNAS
jgi:hypothetical protein